MALPQRLLGVPGSRESYPFKNKKWRGNEADLRALGADSPGAAVLPLVVLSCVI